MKEIKRYQSTEGKIFDTESECAEYEENLPAINWIKEREHYYRYLSAEEIIKHLKKRYHLVKRKDVE